MRMKLRRVVLAVLALMVVLSIGFMTACGDEKTEETPKVTVTLTLDKTTASVEVAQTVTLTPTLKGSSETIVWESSNTNKATVNNGVVTGVEEGSATITARVGDVSATCDVTVTPAIIPVITLNNSTTQIYTGQPLNLNAVVTYDGAEVPEAQLVYVSDNTGVATVSANGVVTGVGKGTANITVDCTYNNKVATQKTVQISVINLTLVEFTTVDGQKLNTGDTLALSADVTLNGDPVSEPDLTFSLSNQDVASIDQGGVLTALSAIDELVVTATYMDGAEPVTDTITISIDYSVVFNGSVELAPSDNSGDFLIKTDKQFASASLNGSALNLVSATDGYTVDTSLFDLDVATQEVILTDENGVKYVANIFNIIKEVNDNVVKVRTDGDFADAASVNYGESVFGRTNVAHVSGNPNKTWQNLFYPDYTLCGYYASKGYKYLAYDLVFVHGADSSMGVTGSDGEFVNFVIGSPVEDDEFAVYDLGHHETNFAENEWQTVIIKIELFTGMIQHYATGGMNAYIDNVRFMSDGAYQDYIDNPVDISVPDTAEISLDNAIVNPGKDYTLVRNATPVTYLEKTAIQFTGANEATWKNNLLIDVGFYKADYKWILVDFYFNSDEVGFDVVGTVNNYAYLTYGSTCNNGSFYVVNEVEGNYYSVLAVKNQWITIAFRTADIRNQYINGIMSSAVDTYVANIRAVTANVLDEPQVISATGTIDNTSITIGYNGVTMGRVDNFAFYSRTGLVHLTGVPTGTYHNEWHIAGLNDLRLLGYKYIAVDILFQTQGISGCLPQVWYLAAPISIPIGGVPSDSALKIYDVAHNETTLGDSYWTTYVFDLSASTQDFLGFFAAGASEWYIDTITAMTEAEHTAFLNKPAKVEVDSLGFVAPNFSVSTADGIGGKDGVTKFATSGAAWYDQVAYVYTNQYVAAGYNTFSLDIYYDGSTSFFAYYFDNINASSIAMGAESAIDGIRLLNASSEDVALASGTWITVKFDITKVSVGAIYLFRSEPSVNMYVTNAYYENIA